MTADGPGLSLDLVAVLVRVSDALIPGDDGLPRASHTPHFEGLLMRAVAARQDAVEEVGEILSDLQQAGDLWTALEALDRDRPEAFHLVSSLAVAAYFMDSANASACGYVAPHRNPASVSDAVDELESGLLDTVMERGPIYRPAH